MYLTCCQCGRVVPDDEQSCPNCGSSELQKYCSECGFKVARKARYCANCSLKSKKNGIEYAGFWIRFMALFIDSLVLLIPNRILDGAFTDQQSLILSGIMSWLYFSLMESSEGRGTLGKRAFGIVVTGVSGTRISFLRATMRYLGKMLSAIILFIGYLMAPFTKKKQALHDMIAGTVVIVRGSR